MEMDSVRSLWRLLALLLVVLLISPLNVEAEKPPTGIPQKVVEGDAFEGCIRAGGQIQEVDPPRCLSKDGTVHTRASAVEKSCKDMCGDGQCQEIVCQALGCPCAESPASCPTDCKE